MNIPKFRAWSKEFQQMFDVETINFHPAYRELTGGVDLNGDEILFSFDEVILMQSTGLTDKNGVDIFEGDKISSNDFPFWNGSKVGRTNEGKICTENKGGFCSAWSAHDWNTKFEVIGNIHTNKELLK